LKYQSQNYSSEDALACVQPLEIHANSHLLNINIFLDPFTPEPQPLFFKMLSPHDEVRNHIKEVGIYHIMKRSVSNPACQVERTPQVAVVIV
jgi:hypothetical protein